MARRLLAMLSLLLACAAPATAWAAQVTLLDITGAITPAMAAYVHRGPPDAQGRYDAADTPRRDTPRPTGCLRLDTLTPPRVRENARLPPAELAQALHTTAPRALAGRRAASSTATHVAAERRHRDAGRQVIKAAAAARTTAAAAARRTRRPP